MRFIKFLKRIKAWRGIIAGFLGLGTTIGMVWGYGLKTRGGGTVIMNGSENPYFGLIIFSLILTVISLLVSIFLLEVGKIKGKYYEKQIHLPLDKLTEKMLKDKEWNTKKQFWFSTLEFATSIFATLLLVLVTALYVKNNGGYDYFSRFALTKYYVVVLIPLYFQVFMFGLKWTIKLFVDHAKNKRKNKKAKTR